MTHPAYHGKTYVGMVIRDNNTWEGISQELQSPIESGVCYEMSLFAARSDTYLSISRKTDLPVNFNLPVAIAISGAFSSISITENDLLAESAPILNTDWEKVIFYFQPTKRYTHLVIEAAYSTAVPNSAYNENVLIDYIQPIVPIACDDTKKSPHLNKDSINIMYPIDLTGLQDFIKTHGQKVRFLGDLDILETHAFTLGKSDKLHQNQYITLICKALHSFKDQKIIIGVVGKNKRNVTNRIKSID